MQRVELARERRGWTSKQLAVAVGVSTKALQKWSDGIPPARIAKLAELLDVESDWIVYGLKPPIWYITYVMTTGKGSIDWKLLSPAQIIAAWWEVMDKGLLDRLLDHDGTLPLPNSLLVERWAFSNNRRRAFFDRLDAQQLQTLAIALGVWPEDHHLQQVIRTSVNRVPVEMSEDASAEPDHWRTIIDRLTIGARGYRASGTDGRLRQKYQSDVWTLLRGRQPGEPALKDQAIVPVLSACVRAARDTEIIFTMGTSLETAVELALLSDFADRKFTMSEMGRYLEQHRGLRLISRVPVDKSKRRHREMRQDMVSEGVILRILTSIAAAGKIPLRKEKGERQWQCGTVPYRAQGKTPSVSRKRLP